MKRFEKIVAEQLKRGDIGTALASSALISKLKNKFKYGVTAYMFIDKHGIGKKYPPLTADQVINEIPKNKGYKNYSNGEYIFVIDDQNPNSGKKETLWDVYIINKKKTFPNVPDQVFDEYKSGQFNQSVIVTFKQYESLLKKQNELAAAKEKADAEVAAAKELEKKKPAIEKTKDVVQNVVKGTSTIDVNNLGKGTADAKAFQELLYQVGIKIHPLNDFHKKFAEYRTKGSDGSWGGVIGNITLSALHQLNGSDDNRLTVKWLAGDKAGVIDELRKTLTTVSESINYFKGTGINIKLKDLINEYLINEQATSAAPEAFGGVGGSSSPSPSPTRVGGSSSPSPSPTPTSTNFTQSTFPGKYTGKGKLTYNNDDVYIGSWVNGKKSGKGEYRSTKWGTVITGTWVDGKRNGIIKITYGNGDVRDATYVDGKMSGPATFTAKGSIESSQENWKNGVRSESNADYWQTAKDWVVAEYNFWKESGSGPKGQKRPVTHKEMFDQFNATGFGNFIGDDDEDGAAKAYLANRAVALAWLKGELAGSVAVTGQDYYSEIKKWIYEIVDSIDDVFQNNCTITLTNSAEGDTITRTVQGEIDVNW